MTLVVSYIFIPVIGILLVPFLRTNWKGIVSYAVVVINALISGYFAILSLSGQALSFSFAGSIVTGIIPLRIDALSGWFILIINLVFLTGGFYGLMYMKAYKEQVNKITLHSISFLLLHSAMVSLCAIQNSFVFVIAWEIMALTAFMLIIFESEKIATIRAGLNFLIQSHISILFLIIGFIWVAHKTGSYDFRAIHEYASSISGASSLALFLVFFLGFAIKAGFVPFHTWLPYAHPASPAHISGILSGVVIKIGIFGVLRMLLLIPTDFYSLGFIILILSLISGLYGVMLAIVQHNLKKLLAYHSIENIGIIGIGIGLGCIGLGSDNQILVTLGFAGALLHTLNHALFKSLLFYTTGNVYQAAHTVDIEKLGGLAKRMPQTAALFLIAAIGISGIPPFNGFISEFIIYSGLYNWIGEATLAPLIVGIFTMPGLVLIGGFAMLCFTKAFGVVFLGNERHPLPETCREVNFIRLLPLYLLASLIVLIGIFPGYFIQILNGPTSLFSGNDLLATVSLQGNLVSLLQSVSRAMWIFILVILVIFVVRKYSLSRRQVDVRTTWGCGYAAVSAKQQYTASSFVRTYTKLFQFVLQIEKDEKEVQGVFPGKSEYKTHPYDKVEKWLIDKPLKANKTFMGRFLFLNNGKLQLYILYGIIFILSVISIPLIYNNILLFIDFLKQL
jgi:hydrogenase-4 component B